MSLHLQREIEKLKKKILSLGAKVEDSLQTTFKATKSFSVALTDEIRQNDNIVDDMEVDVEEECLKILALHQPVATDLRFVISVLKINNDLERVGDLAVNIANKVSVLSKADELPVKIDFQPMFNLSQKMLKDSLDALVNMDVVLARKTCATDDIVDKMKAEIKSQISSALRSKPEQVDFFLALLGITRNLERIADLATNISEDVIYMVEGSIVRHKR